MSGGHLQYQQDSIMDIAEEIQNVIYNNDDESIDEWDGRADAACIAYYGVQS